ncbi:MULTISPECIES: hypothetical protein [Thalassospira]|uniref:Uncharacterized protein n=1 Tax=Thalassospira aquimaris TaxID=3037796 RepID=A0ABT6GB60_9PROT|nr:MULTISPECIES: hypothetical protein [Thalassospira]MDG4719239.1 hypothetical protein [Thalassospira sp. FZY0004]
MPDLISLQSTRIGLIYFDRARSDRVASNQFWPGQVGPGRIEASQVGPGRGGSG